MSLISARRVIGVPHGGGGADTGTCPRIRHWLEWCLGLKTLGTIRGRHLGLKEGGEERVSPWGCGAAGRREGPSWPEGQKSTGGRPNTPSRGRWQFSQAEEGARPALADGKASTQG